ncbi:MAG TPA: FHA domain-containing protein, partial [Kofleriaceae bacterium]|nr:FHA domain-containing protein [Kofleriaceae bacterium]
MGSPFAITARCEHKNVEPGPSKLWASIKIDARGGGLEQQRAPLAIALAIDISGSMHGDAIAHVLKSCEIVADLLGEHDRLSIVTFATHVGVRCGLTAVDAAGRAAIKATLAGIVADGNTNIHGGLEVAAGVLMTAPAGLRRAIVLMSDGQPNVSLSTAAGLAGFVRTLGIAVSTLGFGHAHDENVLDAIAVAGSGRYAYVPDPVLARVDLARAALAHGGIVADHLELKLVPAAGVELIQILPATQLRVGGGGVTAPVGDVFVDEGRIVAIELQLTPNVRGPLADVIVTGSAPDGTAHSLSAKLDVDVRVGPRVIDRDAQRDVVLVRAEAARGKAREHSDRGALASAALVAREAVAMIDATEGFVRYDGSLLAELREQLEDEAANYERVSTNQERGHQRKTAVSFKAASPTYSRQAKAVPPIPARLVGMGGPATGQTYYLSYETIIGRGSYGDIEIRSGMLSRQHTRFVFVGDHYVVHDLGSTNGTLVNGHRVASARLAHDDVIQIGDVVVRFEIIQNS